jgi:transposase, IS30 family
MCFFADPFFSWQRGSNENANGLLRRHLPKGTDLSLVTAQKVRRVVEQINNKPRKLLGWKTAKEVHCGVSVALIT